LFGLELGPFIVRRSVRGTGRSLDRERGDERLLSPGERTYIAVERPVS